jgi:predicted transcriptional regulator
MKNKDDMSIVSLLARSKKRISVLKSLEKEDKIPSRISKDIDDNSNHVSKYLKTLKDAELVECLNEEDKRYRFYSITDKGKYYLDKVEKNYNFDIIKSYLKCKK